MTLSTSSRLALVVLAACAPDAPATPSFQQHVMPILAANCVRCHGYPPIGGAPASLRLDSYGAVAVDDQNVIAGAGVTAALIADRIAGDAAPMPPRFPLDDFQIETLERWATAAPAGEAPPRGEPRIGNRSPQVVLERVVVDGSNLAIAVAVDDPDGDLVAGELHADVGGVDRVLGPLRSGRFELAWSTTGVPPGSYRVTARADDGAEAVTLELGQLAIGGP